MVCHLSRSVQRFRRDVASTKTRICFIIIDFLITFTVILPSAYDSLRPRFRRHNLWLEEGLYVRLPYGHEDPKTYFYYEQSHHFLKTSTKGVKRFRPQDVPHDLVTDSSQRRTGVWVASRGEDRFAQDDQFVDSSFHDQVRNISVI